MENFRSWFDVSGALARMLGNAGARRLAAFTITVGDDGTIFGYNRNLDLGASIGNISGVNFTDASGNARTLTAIFDAAGSGAPADLRLALDGTSVPDTDATFAYIVANGTIYARSARTSYSSDTGAENDSAWRWGNEATNEYGAGGSLPIEIWG